MPDRSPGGALVSMTVARAAKHFAAPTVKVGTPTRLDAAAESNTDMTLNQVIIAILCRRGYNWTLLPVRVLIGDR
jgi:hypothetical protein